MRNILILVQSAFLFSVLAGCQTTGLKTDVASIEQSLIGVGVSLPPRNPFSNIRVNIPKSLTDIKDIVDCGTFPEQNITEWVDSQKEFYSGLNKGTDIYSLRIVAERTFQEGLPRHAAAFLKKVIGWSNPTWKSEILGSNAFLATFYAAYGEFDKANKHLNIAIVNNQHRRYKSCVTRNSYWLNRAKAYVSLAEGENQVALKSLLTAQDSLKAHILSTDNECGGQNRKVAWRYIELYALLGKAYFQLGDLNNAEAYARKTVDRWSPGKTYIERTGLQILSQIKMRQGRYKEALSFSLLSRRAQLERCVTLSAPERAETNRDIALTMTALNRFDSAYMVMNETESNLKPEPELWNNLFANSVDRGLILRETGHLEEAKTVFRQAVTRLREQFGTRHYFTVEARVLLAQSEGKKSINEMTRLIRELLSLWQERAGQLTSDQKSLSIRLKWIVEDYLSRVFSANGDEQALGEAFEIAEIMRSGQVQEALVQTALRKLAPDIETRDLIRRQQDMKKQLVVIRQLKDDGSAYGNVGTETLGALTQKVDKIEAAVASLTASVRSAIPDYDNIIGAQAFKLTDALSVLEPDEAIVSLISGRKESFVWVITADGTVSGRKIAKTKQDWEDDVRVIRANLRVPNGRLTDIAPFNTKAAYNLYSDLLQPLESHWSLAKHLIFVIDNDLASIPMGMLLREKVPSPPVDDLMFAGLKDLPWLIRTHAISMAPSMTSLALLRKGSSSDNNRLAFLGVGDPIFNKLDAATRQIEVADAAVSRSIDSFSLRAISTTRGLDSAGFDRLPRLPDTADEIIAIADIVGADRQRDILVGSRAAESTIRDMSARGVLRQYRILSFATHGLVPGELDGLLSPALALSLPLDEPKGDWDDGLLTADEIMELDLDADWAILSACNTASAKTSSTEAFSGLGQAFFYAGARSLLLSNWPVFSDSTRHLMVAIFKHELNTPSRAQALRAATLEIMNEGMFKSSGVNSLDFSYAHPLFWAPFTLVGDGGA